MLYIYIERERGKMVNYLMAADGENGVAMAIHEDDLMGVAGIVIHPKDQAAVGANHRETITAKQQRFSPNRKRSRWWWWWCSFLIILVIINILHLLIFDPFWTRFQEKKHFLFSLSLSFFFVSAAILIDCQCFVGVREEKVKREWIFIGLIFYHFVPWNCDKAYTKHKHKQHGHAPLHKPNYIYYNMPDMYNLFVIYSHFSKSKSVKWISAEWFVIHVFMDMFGSE